MKFHSLFWFIVVAALHSDVANASVLVTSAPDLDAGKVANGLNATSAAVTLANAPQALPFALAKWQLHSLRSGLAFAHWQSGKSVNAITVPECAVIVKLVNSTRHEFQIVPVKCPAPKDYWLTSSQMVYFESSDLIEVTRQKDVVIGSLVKFVLPSEAEVRRFTRGARGRTASGRKPTGYSQFHMLLMGLRSLYDSSSRLWRQSIYGVDLPSVEDDYDEYVVQLKKEPELRRLRDETIEHWAALAAKDLGEAEAPDAYANYQRMDDYTWESVQVPMF
jgi:hypothetical protein